MIFSTTPIMKPASSNAGIIAVIPGGNGLSFIFLCRLMVCVVSLFSDKSGEKCSIVERDRVHTNIIADRDRVCTIRIVDIDRVRTNLDESRSYLVYTILPGRECAKSPKGQLR